MPTTSIQYSPTELLLQIFQFLPRSSLLECATVCRTWQAPAIKLFYESVELSEKTKSVWLHIVNNEEAPCTQNVGVFVKKLTVSLAFSTTMKQADFLKVLSYLPFVKSIDLNSSGYKLHYLAYLNKREQNCVTYLEDIDTGDLFTNYQMQQYFLCAYSFRHSLKHLTLRNPYSSLIIGQPQHQQQQQQPTTVLSLIKDFENLNYLSVISDAPADNNELLLLMNSLQGCSKMAHLTYRNNYLQMHYSPNYDEFHQLHKKLMSQPPFLYKLQTIELHLPILTEHYVKNILCSFPLHLNALMIEMTHTDYKSWIQDCTELFQMYLGYVKNLKIAISAFNRRGSGNTRRIPTSIEQASRYWQFMRSVIGDRQVFSQVQFTAYKSGTKPDLLIERNGNHFSLSYNSDELQDLYSFAEELFLLNSTQQGVCFNSMVVEIGRQNVDSTKKRFETLGSILSSDFAYNTLQSILILFPHIANSQEESYIELKHCSSLPNLNYHYDQLLTHHLMDSTKYTAVFKNIDFKDVPLDLITSSLTSDFQSLELIQCKNYTQSPCGSYIIDLAHVKHLRLFVLDLSFLLSDEEMKGRHVFIKLDLLSTYQTVCYKLCMYASTCCITETTLENMENVTSLSIRCQSMDTFIGFNMGESFMVDVMSLTK